MIKIHTTIKNKIYLMIDSHSLSDYQQCPQRYKWTTIEEIQPRRIHNPFERGIIISKLLEEFYAAKIRNEVTKGLLHHLIKAYIQQGNNLSEEDRELIQTRFLMYIKFYQDELWIPIAAEKGFSKKLYEDEQFCFIYEGRPDLVVWLSPKKELFSIVDHKSESRKNDIYPYNNQAQGYCWAANTPIVHYNYFGLQSTGGPKEWFRRKSHIFTVNDISKWKQTTIEWFRRIAQDTDFIQSWQCEGKYGVCQYHQLCEVNDYGIQKGLVRLHFKPTEFRVW